jgi:CubicO group peptidase (beta-lactamase class C family)
MVDDVSVMQTFPPGPSAQVDLGNWRDPPFNRWAFHHVPQIVPCAPVWTGENAAHEWSAHSQDIEAISFLWNGKKTTVSDMLQQTFTDGFVVLQNGRLIHTCYGAGMQPHHPHILFSVTKSVVGLMAGILVEAGQLEVNRQITDYIPEVAQSGYAGATVRELLDMTVGVEFDEDYLSQTGDIARYRQAAGWNVGDTRDAIGLRKFVATIPGGSSHGQVVRYCSPGTDLLGWILERVSGQAFADLLSASLWQPIGAKDTAFIAVDRFGAPRASAGLCVSTRDLARLGEVVINMGTAGAKRIIPEFWIEEIINGGITSAWSKGTFANAIPNASYRACWYKYGAQEDAIGGFGTFGQALYLHPASKIVFAKLSSYPVPMDVEHETLQRAAFQAIVQELG